jgi:hypothetical protein
MYASQICFNQVEKRLHLLLKWRDKRNKMLQSLKQKYFFAFESLKITVSGNNFRDVQRIMATLISSPSPCRLMQISPSDATLVM